MANRVMDAADRYIELDLLTERFRKEGSAEEEDEFRERLVNPHPEGQRRLTMPEGFPTEVVLRRSLTDDLLPEGRWTLLGDENVRSHWTDHRLPEPPGTLWVPTSEALKRLESLIPWLEAWACLPLHRDATIVAVGGGVLTDMAGLAASLFLRGRGVALLADDPARPGWTRGWGARRRSTSPPGRTLPAPSIPPERLVVCTDFLATLSRRHLAAGAWELCKHALIEGDLAWAERLLAGGTPGLGDLERSLGQKGAVVHRDAREQGERRLLNLGTHPGPCPGIGLRLPSCSTERPSGLGTLAACLLAETEGLPAFPEDFLRGFAQRLRPLAGRIPAWEACLPVLARDKKALRGIQG